MRTLLIATALATASLVAQSDAERRAIVRVDRIWDRAAHCAFTDLMHWRGAMWCTFREGSKHVPGHNGVTRVLVERNGIWQSAASIDEAGIDLRDPKLSVTPKGQLMVLMGGSRYEGSKRVGMRSRVSFLTFDGPLSPVRPVVIDPKIASPHDWLWRVTWHQGRGFGTVYQHKQSGPELHLVSTTDGVRYKHITRLELDGRANETTVRFLPDGRMVAVVRREQGDQHGRIGTAPPPFTDWSWKPLPVRLGGPNLLVLPNASGAPTLLVASRSYQPKTSTMIAQVELDGTMTPLLHLPSGGDTSYAGMVPLRDRLHVSYYSSHERRTAVYLAELRTKELLDLGR